MNIRKICTSILVIVTLNSTLAYAAPLSDQLQQQKNQLQQNKAQLKDAEDKREELETQIQDLDVQIETTLSNIEDYKKKITQTEKDIKATEVDLKKSEDDIKKQQSLLDKRVRAIYKSGQNSYIQVLLEADSFSDLVSTVVNMKRIVDYDNKIIAEFKAKQDEINKKKELLDSQKNSIVAMKAESEQKLASIRETSKTQSALIEQLKQQEKAFAAKVNQSQAQVDATLAQIASIRSATPKYTPSRGSAPISDNAIIAYASNFLGTPYVWGGSSPNPGFDCSGFTSYVYAHFGVSLGRTTKDQIYDGTAVSKDNLQTGDLVLFGSGGVPNHVGIYVGNNTYIHAPQTGDVVKVSSMNRGGFITGRRVK